MVIGYAPFSRHFQAASIGIPSTMRGGKKTVLVINGPNLNLLGLREPQIYGHETLKDVENSGVKHGQQLNAEVEFFQT